MNCLEAQHRMNLYLEKRLNDQEVPIFLDHIHNCKECREELDLYLAIFMTLHDDMQDENGPYVDGETLEKQMLSSRKELRRRHVSRAARFGSLVVLVLAVLVFQYWEAFIRFHKDRVDRWRNRNAAEVMTEEMLEDMTEDMTEGMSEYISGEIDDVVAEGTTWLAAKNDKTR